MTRPRADRTNQPRVPSDGPAPSAAAAISRHRGQILVIFAGGMVALMMLMAMVVDIGWYWSSNLKMQRAADAAALAGAVYLPDNFNGTAPNAQTAALAAAKRNGYVPDTDTTIAMNVDANNPRQLDVTITDKINTFFLRVVGIQALNAARSSKAEFVLPVPMGSPQNYYGFGTFVGMTIPKIRMNYINPTSPQATYVDPASGADPSAVTAGAWSNPTKAYASDGTYATASADGSQQIWKGFAFGSFQPGALFDGVGLNLEVKIGTFNAACSVKAEVSWDGGGHWGSSPDLATPTASKTDTWFLLGSNSDPLAWDSAHAWVPADFTTTNNFQVRLTYVKPKSCGTVSVDDLNVIVSTHTMVDGTPVEGLQTMPGPGATSLTSQGFWGAVITRGGSRENGDQFDPSMDNYKSMANPNYDGKGVDYNIVIGGPGGQVQLFDPTFCETGPSSGGGYYGAGDHWIAGAATAVTTTYSLWNQNGTPYDITDDTQVATSGNLFAGQVQADYSGNLGSPGHNGLTNCASDPYHDAWYPLATGLGAGNYRLNVSADTASDATVNAENMWSAWVTSTTGVSQVYGEGRMVTYNNLLGTSKQQFYLAQIDKIHAGKTMEIKLFDPGDVSGNAYLRILSPDGNAYSYVNFTYTADNGLKSTTPVSTIQTAAAPNHSYFQDALITIEIPLPATYGSTGLTPPGVPGAGWWQIEYTVAGGNDTTTWQVDIQGNPVHLLVP